ncbi:hypothetical protein ACW5R3_01355 [Bizionia sp. KMM 8389]
MKTQIKDESVKGYELHNFQIDFVKLKLYNVNIGTINWGAFIGHPNLKNHYSLVPNLPNMYSKNFDMYMDKGNNITVRMSIPYLIENHNYRSIEDAEMCFVLQELQRLTNLNFPQAKVVEFEFGAFDSIDIDASQYIKKIEGLVNFDLLKATSYMKMFGSNTVHYKIYNAVQNAKSKKTFTRGNYPDSKLIKHELKIKSPKEFLGKSVTAFDLASGLYTGKLKVQLDFFKQLIMWKQDVIYQLEQTNMTHVLYTSLKNVESLLETTVFNLVKEVIDNSGLTSSQKSKRKKSLLELETTYNAQLQKR